MTSKEKKEIFVGMELTSLLQKINSDVHYAEYKAMGNGEEFVYIHYTNGYKKQVCITADSFSAIAVDVIMMVG